MTRLPATIIALLAIALAAPAANAKPSLKRFQSCDRLVAYANKHAPRYVAGGPPQQFEPSVARPMPPDAAGGPMPVAAPEASADAGSGDFSLTNNQEAGVFEPDIVKTDGKTVYAVTGERALHIVDVTRRAEPRSARSRSARGLRPPAAALPGPPAGRRRRTYDGR